MSKDKPHQHSRDRVETRSYRSGNQQITIEVHICSCGVEYGKFVVNRENLN